MSELELLLRLPWTVERQVRQDDGEYLVLTIRELEGFVVAGRTDQEVEEAFWPALEEFLESYLETGEEPPVPESAREWMSLWRRMKDGRAVVQAAPREPRVYSEESVTMGASRPAEHIPMGVGAAV